MIGIAVRPAERARTETWTYEEFLAACLQRDVSARDSRGGEGCIRASGTHRSQDRSTALDPSIVIKNTGDRYQETPFNLH